MSNRLCPICFDRDPKVVETRSIADPKTKTWCVIRKYRCGRGHTAMTSETMTVKDDRQRTA